MQAAIKAPQNLPELPQELFPELTDSLRPACGELAALGALSQIAPGVWVSGMPAFDVPSHVLCRLVPGTEAGTYTLVPDGPFPGYVRMSDDFGKRIGIIGLATTTVYRLLAGGFVDHIRMTPGGLFISIESLLEHFRCTANDCEREESYWTHARLQAWRETISGISNIAEWSSKKSTN